MTVDVTISDPDRQLDFLLALEFTYRGRSRARMGWNDGGEPGEGAAVEIDRARCTEVVVWCGKRALSAIPGLAAEERLERTLGEWCLANYPDEIERALWQLLHARRGVWEVVNIR